MHLSKVPPPTLGAASITYGRASGNALGGYVVRAVTATGKPPALAPVALRADAHRIATSLPMDLRLGPLDTALHEPGKPFGGSSRISASFTAPASALNTGSSVSENPIHRKPSFREDPFSAIQ